MRCIGLLDRIPNGVGPLTKTVEDGQEHWTWAMI
jgi:hypothetical protein